VFAFGLALIAVVAQDTPPIDGARLQPADRCSELLYNGQLIGVSRTIIKAVDHQGIRAWDIVIHQSVPTRSFDMRDHFVVRADTLRPLAFDNSRSGVERVRLVYADTSIAGSRSDKGVATPVAVVAPSPVWEGNLYGPLFAALPLREGGDYTIPSYQYDKGIGRFVVKVTGSETIVTPEGPVEAWTLDIDSGGPFHATYLIAKRDGTELGTRSGPFTSRLGGDCSNLD
jgi:hypothetical protein